MGKKRQTKKISKPSFVSSFFADAPGDDLKPKTGVGYMVRWMARERRAAEALASALAEMPPEVVAAFNSEASIKLNHLESIRPALMQDRDAVIHRAVALRSAGVKLRATQVVRVLLGDRLLARSPSLIQANGEDIGSWYQDQAGATILKFRPGFIDEADVERMIGVLRSARQDVRSTQVSQETSAP